MNRVRRIALFLLLLSLPLPAAAATELEILQSFFSPAGMHNKSLVLAGAAAERYARRPTLGETLPPGTEVAFRVLDEGPFRAVYEVMATPATGSRSWSAFFLRGGLGAKLEALPGMNFPPYLYQTFDALAALGEQRSPEASARYRNLKLVLMTSVEFKEYFNNNRAIFDEIARLVETGRLDEARTAARRADLADVLPYGETLSEGEQALLATVSPGSGKHPAAPGIGSEIRVGGFLERTTGFLHLPEGVLPPPMTPGDYILVEALDVGWYLFRNIAVTPAETREVPGGNSPRAK